MLFSALDRTFLEKQLLVFSVQHKFKNITCVMWQVVMLHVAVCFWLGEVKSACQVKKLSESIFFLANNEVPVSLYQTGHKQWQALSNFAWLRHYLCTATQAGQ